MKTIIAGGRNITDQRIVDYAILNALFKITEVVSGCAPGVDTLGEEWANYYKIPIKRFPADWDRHGRKAGPIRNSQMAQYAEALVAVWDGKSPGTKNMIETAKKVGLKVYVYRV